MSDQSTNQEEDATAVLAKKRYKESSDYVKPYFDRFLDNYKHYYMRIIDEAVESDSEAYPFYSQLSLPISYQIVETLQPRLFNRMPSFNIKTEMPNDANDEKALEELIKYQLQHPYLIDDPIFSRLITAGKEMFITGNAWGSVPWMYKTVEVEEWQPYSAQLGITEPSWDNMEKIQFYGAKPDWKLVKVQKNLIDAPVFKHESIFHVFPDPKKKRVSDLGYGIIERKMSPQELKDMINMSVQDYNPESLKKLEDMFKDKEWGTIGGTDYDSELAGIFGATDPGYQSGDSEEGQLKVWMMSEPGKASIIVNEKLTIRDGSNPNGDGKIGLMLMKDIPVPHELYAWGEIDPIKKIEDAMTDQTNMRVDSVFYDLLRMWKLDPESMVDGEEFVPEPGAIVKMKKMDGLQPIDTGTTKPTAYKEYSEWEGIVQSATGVTDYATGNSDPTMNKTMGGVQLLQQAANARFSMKMQLFEHLGLKAMGTMYVQRNLRFFDTPQSINTGKEKIIVTPEMIRRIRGNIHFIVNSGSTEAIDKGQEVTKWDTLTKMLGKPPFENLSPKALDAWAERIMLAMDERETELLLERALPPAPPVGPDGLPLPVDAAGNPVQNIPTAPVEPTIEEIAAQPGAVPTAEPVIPEA